MGEDTSKAVKLTRGISTPLLEKSTSSPALFSGAVPDALIPTFWEKVNVALSIKPKKSNLFVFIVIVLN